MYASEARDRRGPPPEAERRHLGLQAPGGRPALHPERLNDALCVSKNTSFCVQEQSMIA